MQSILDDLKLGKANWSQTTKTSLLNYETVSELQRHFNFPVDGDIRTFYRQYNHDYLTPDWPKYHILTEAICLAIDSNHSLLETLLTNYTGRYSTIGSSAAINRHDLLEKFLDLDIQRSVDPEYRPLTVAELNNFMFYVAKSGNLPLVKRLVSRGADNFEAGMSSAIKSGDSKTIDYFLDKTIKLETTDENISQNEWINKFLSKMDEKYDSSFQSAYMKGDLETMNRLKELDSTLPNPTITPSTYFEALLLSTNGCYHDSTKEHLAFMFEHCPYIDQYFKQIFLQASYPNAVEFMLEYDKERQVLTAEDYQTCIVELLIADNSDYKTPLIILNWIPSNTFSVEQLNYIMSFCHSIPLMTKLIELGADKLTNIDEKRNDYQFIEFHKRAQWLFE